MSVHYFFFSLRAMLVADITSPLSYALMLGRHIFFFDIAAVLR